MYRQQLVYLSALSLASIINSSMGADSAQGKALYEARCLECHKESPYAAGSPKARTLEAVRAYSVLWDSLVTGPQWTKDEGDNVVTYLNERFYRY